MQARLKWVRLTGIWLAGLIIMAGMPACAGAQPDAIALKIETPPVIDGVLDDGCWSGYPVITEFVSLKDAGARHAHRIWLTHDDTWLYMAVDIRHPNPSRMTLDCREHDGSVSNDDSLEVFIDPGTAGRLYFHYLLSAGNAQAEQRAGKDGMRDRAWNAPWRSATRVTDTGWTAELAIPLAVLASYGDIEKTSFNICLNIFDPVMDPQGIQVDMRRMWLTWRPLRASYHEPEKFGELRFAGIKDLAIKHPFLPALASRPVVGAYKADESGLNYTVAVEVTNHSMVKGTVRLVALDKPASGGVNRIEKLVALAPAARKSLEIVVPVADPASRTVAVVLEHPDTGEVLQRDIVADTSSLTLMTVYPERNYFTGEPEVGIICEMGLPASALPALRAELRDAAGALLAETETILPLTRLAAERARFDAGAHALKLLIKRKSGPVLFEQAVTVVCRPPRPGREVKIDHVNRVLLRNGEPFFPFGLISHATNEAAFKEIANAGHNTLMWWLHIKPEDGPLYMERARQHNLLMWMPVEKFCNRVRLTGLKVALIQGGPPPHHWSVREHVPSDDTRALRDFSPAEKSAIYAAAYAKALPEMLAGVGLIKDYDNLLAYSNFDEAPGARFFDQWVQGLDLYKQVQALDGYRPMYALASAEEFDFNDIIGPDPYWVPGHASARGSPLHVVDMHYMFDQRARPGRKPVVHVPVGERWSGMHQRYLTPAEQFCQTYLALIHGAKGLLYFCYPFTHESSFETLGTLARQMQTLGPALTAPEAPQTFVYEPGAMDYVNKQYPDVHARMFRHPDGRHILLAANCRPYPVDVKYTVSLLKDAGAVERLFGAGQYPVNEGAFDDRLEAYGVRAYEIRSQESGVRSQHEASGMINVALSMTGHPDQTPAEYATPASPRAGWPDKRNLMPNPSFEQATLPGLPDYYRATYMPGPRIGQAGALWGLDTKHPWHGAVSMRLANGGIFDCYIAPQVQRPKPMVFSGYFRADRDGVEIDFNPGALGESRKFKLTPEWQRYSVSLSAAPGVSEYNTIGIRVPKDAVIWTDAWQLELGDTPTDFEE